MDLDPDPEDRTTLHRFEHPQDAFYYVSAIYRGAASFRVWFGFLEEVAQAISIYRHL